MKASLLACAALLLLADCRTTRTPESPQRDYSHSEGTPYAPFTPRVPDSVVVKPHRSLLDKLTGRKAKGGFHTLPTSIGKKSTVSVYYGPATVTTNTAAKKAAAGPGATTVTKPDAPVATAAGDAVDNTKAGQRGGAAATAPNATATATTIKPPTPWLKYGLWAAGISGAYWLLFGGGGAVLLALWRRNKSTPNQA